MCRSSDPEQIYRGLSLSSHHGVYSTKKEEARTRLNIFMKKNVETVENTKSESAVSSSTTTNPPSPKDNIRENDTLETNKSEAKPGKFQTRWREQRWYIQQYGARQECIAPGAFSMGCMML